MKVNYEKKEIHLCNPSIEEIVETLEARDMLPDFHDFKIMIDGLDEDATFEG